MPSTKQLFKKRRTTLIFVEIVTAHNLAVSTEMTVVTGASMGIGEARWFILLSTEQNYVVLHLYLMTTGYIVDYQNCQLL